MSRVTTDGKQFALGGKRFRFAGVTYGTFANRGDGHLYPATDQVLRDFAEMAARGFTVVRTYTPPPDDVIAAAETCGLRLLAGVFWPDWRYQVAAGGRAQRAITDAAVAAVTDAARRFAGSEQVLALSLGNEIPADVIRWVGTATVEAVLAELAAAVRAVDPDMLITYGNYPTAEYLDLPTLDFLTFNVFLERPNDLRRYLTRLHNLTGDRPLVLGETGLHAGTSADGAQAQADVLDWQLATALERGVAGTCVFSWTDDWTVGDNRVTDWNFGLTTADRTARPALAVVERWNRRTVADLDHPWPPLSIVICAYNADRYIDECLTHTCALDYPDLDIVVVDDGSTDRTAEIVAQHPRARLVTVPHAGLSVARNAGIDAARHDLIAYLDADAYPSPEWPYYLALGFNSNTVGAAGGPNVPPREDPPGAHIVAQAPGGPVHVLTADDRAEHVPGCNMAFWRYALAEVGGFDPVFTSAGDDVDVCWKVLDAGLEIGFHPAALVWHHRRPTIRAYLRQQRGYGRSEALVESRHPDRYTPLGTARWLGRIYSPAVRTTGRRQIYHGPFGAASYQSVYGAPGHAGALAYQLGGPIAVASLPTLLAAPLMPAVAIPGVVGLVFLLGLLAAGMLRASPPLHAAQSRLRFRATVAALHVIQPLVRVWGRYHRNQVVALPEAAMPALPDPVERLGRNHLLFPAQRPRTAVAADVVAGLRAAGLRVLPLDAWNDVDATIAASTLTVGELTTSDHPQGWTQLRLRTRIRWCRLTVAIALAVALVAVVWPLAVLTLAAVAGELVRGWWTVARRAGAEVTSGTRQPTVTAHAAAARNDAAEADTGTDAEREMVRR
jgi:O-antigen biosynthesis protein